MITDVRASKMFLLLHESESVAYSTPNELAFFLQSEHFRSRELRNLGRADLRGFTHVSNSCPKLHSLSIS